MKTWIILLFIFFPLVAWSEIKVGSKAFTEGFLLAELAAQTIESKSNSVVIRKFGLGNTGIVFEALKKGEIDFYPEYTGTISEAILKSKSAGDIVELRKKLEGQGLTISEPLGFNNTYALAVTREFSETNSLRKISDLKRVESNIKTAFSHEFAGRADGLPALQKAYNVNLNRTRQSLEHSLLYEAIRNRKVDLIEVYSTDPKIEESQLILLEDDRGFFPKYDAVFLARSAFVRENPMAWSAINSLAKTLNEKQMQTLNAQIEIEKKSFGRTIDQYLRGENEQSDFVEATIFSRVWQRTKEHLFLVGLTVFFAIVSGVPLGIIASRNERLSQVLLLISSIIQTIPSLALLSLLIPFFGIGLLPAIIALYMYSLLPILLNTFIGLRSIDRKLLETAQAIGLKPSEVLQKIELPLASPMILAGVKTSAVIGIGTATLAALIGAGGYGAPIVTGLAINDTNTILMGAIPAAAMALFVHFSFELANKWITPNH